ncbi:MULTISPECIES: GNAT family N-acetyltransferase [Campylobacter]|uniref:GNAT family N-acetyltransferase n=1 Tax=Campylobacter TaxID=194 RepID=UPI000B3F82D2|nr:GNAT family N-acetyltransferase [Campylobacter sp. CNRCH_2013_0855]EAJ6151129.1 GNAT family N-acetyltransferase [Campylobacter lari]MCR8677490.1 GNAT family N-acetyltransferase [Campylobacter sp. S4:11]EHZ4885935.1 GNAT family N-acetyltransferase [Campylobacter lari]MBT0824650.1 GNAT family N-acetyltransferase [Campylobacter lari]MBT0828013.1 GNAT family N-acetyltransferase [Campylobacter lari]
MRIINISNKKDLLIKASKWFSEKWGIDEKIYFKSIKNSFNSQTIPQWYLVLDKNTIIAGAGIIQNDFHKRKDLEPNLCALYVEENYRGNKISSQLLKFIKNDLKTKNINKFYLLTELVGFYEKYDGIFIENIVDNEAYPLRVYKIEF